MSQKRRKADSGRAIGEMTALRWEPTHITKPNPRVVPLHALYQSYNSTQNHPIDSTFLSEILDTINQQALLPHLVQHTY